MMLRRFAAGTALLALPLSAARADEGMWTFDAFPAAKMRAAYGWAPDQTWLDNAHRLPPFLGESTRTGVPAVNATMSSTA